MKMSRKPIDMHSITAEHHCRQEVTAGVVASNCRSGCTTTTILQSKTAELYEAFCTS
jgi:hypothetical protein